MRNFLIIICLAAISVPSLSDYAFMGDYFKIPVQITDQFLSGQTNIDSYFQTIDLADKENIHFNLGFEHGQPWAFARWSALFPWTLYGDEIDTWLRGGGETNIPSVELRNSLRYSLGLSEKSTSWVKNWMTVFLKVQIPDLAKNLPLPLDADTIPFELRAIIPADGKNRLEWFLDLFNYILSNIKEQEYSHEIKVLLEMLIGKLKLYTTHVNKSDVFQVIIKETDHSLTVRQLGHSLTNFFMKIYPDWKTRTTQWLLNIGLRFIFADGLKDYKLEKLPEFIKLIVQDVQIDNPYLFILSLLKKIKGPSDEISTDVYSIVREIVTNIEIKVPQLEIPVYTEERISVPSNRVPYIPEVPVYTEESLSVPVKRVPYLPEVPVNILPYMPEERVILPYVKPEVPTPVISEVPVIEQKKSEVIVLFIESKEYKVSVNLVRETITKIFTKQYSNWHPKTSQWLLNSIMQFLDSEDPKTTEFAEVPTIIETIIPGAHEKKTLEVMLILLETIITSSDDEPISPKVLTVFKEIRHKIQVVLNFPVITKWILYKQNYIPIGSDGTPLLNIKSISAGQVTDLVTKWVTVDGIMRPVGYDGQPWLVISVPIVKRWVIVNNFFIAIGEDEQLVPNLKPLAPGEQHPFVVRWITKQGISVPQNPDGSVSLVSIVGKWTYANDVYQAFGEDGNPIPGLPALFPGQVTSFITWRQTSTGPVLIGPDGNEILIEERRKVVLKENIVRFISVHDIFYAIGPDNEPLIGHSALKPGDTDSLISSWVNEYGKLIPLLNDGSKVPVFSIEYFLQKDGKLVAMGVNDQTVPGIKPLAPGDENTFVSWQQTTDGLIPIGPDGVAVLVKSEDEVVLQIKNKEYRISLVTLEHVITKAFVLRYPNWRQTESKWVLALIVQFLESDDELKIDYSDLPEVILKVFPNIRKIQALQFLSRFFTRLFNHLKSDRVPHKVLIVLKEIRHRILVKLPKPTVIKWVLYRQKYIPLGADEKPLSELEPVKEGDINSNIQSWLLIDGLMTPIGLDGQPMPVLKVPTIRHWFVINNLYIAFGEDGQPIPNFKPLAQGESHRYILGWVTINGKSIPESWDHSIPLLDVVIKWILINGLYQPIGEDGKPIPGLSFLTPGEVSTFITWITTGNGLKPIGPDGNALIVEERKTIPPPEKVIRWIIINERYIPIGINDKPLSGYSPLKVGETNTLVSEWILEIGKQTPVLTDGSKPPYYFLEYFLQQGDRLLAIDINGESIPGIDLLLPGESNPYVSWRSTENGLIPIGPDGNLVLVKTVRLLVLTIRNKEYKISLDLLQETVLKILLPTYPKIKSKTVLWIVSLIVQFVESQSEMTMDLDTIPEQLYYVLPNARESGLYRILFKILHKVLILADPDIISYDILVVLKEIKHRVELKLPKKPIIKWILYSGKYIAVGSNDIRLLEIEPLEAGEKNQFIQSWTEIEGIMIPIGSDGKPMPVVIVPTIKHWVVVGNKYFALGTDERIILKIKPLNQEERHTFVFRWVTIDGTLIPERPDGTIPPVDVVDKLLFSDGLYIMLRRDGSPVPGINPIAPGEESVFLTWRYTTYGQVPVGLDGNLLIVEERIIPLPQPRILPAPPSLPIVIRWIKINNLYLPIGQDEQPIIGYSALNPGDNDPLVSNWIIVDDSYVPVLSDGSQVQVFILVHFVQQGRQLVAIGINGEIIPGIGPLNPGEINPYVTWLSTQDGLIPVGPDNRPVKILPARSEEPEIAKWITVNNIYLPVDKHGKAPPNVPPLLLGKPSPHILRWSQLGGRSVPIGLDGSPMLVEESGYETKLPSGIQIIWKLINGKYMPLDTYGNILSLRDTSQTIDQSEVQKLLWHRLGSNFPSTYRWLNPILGSLLQMQPETKRLSRSYFSQAPEEIVRVFPLPSRGRDSDMLKWLQTILLTLTNPLPGGELDLGLVNILQKCADKLEYLKIQSH